MFVNLRVLFKYRCHNPAENQYRNLEFFLKFFLQLDTHYRTTEMVQNGVVSLCVKVRNQFFVFTVFISKERIPFFNFYSSDKVSAKDLAAILKRIRIDLDFATFCRIFECAQ